MSNSHQSSPLSDEQTSNELATLATMLSEVAQALRDFHETTPPDPKETAGYPSNGEIRSYYFSPSVLRLERRLLKKHRAHDFIALLYEAHFLVAGIVKIMITTRGDVRLPGNLVSSLGLLLDRVSGLLLHMRHVYEKVERVRT